MDGAPESQGLRRTASVHIPAADAEIGFVVHQRLASRRAPDHAMVRVGENGPYSGQPGIEYPLEPQGAMNDRFYR